MYYLIAISIGTEFFIMGISQENKNNDEEAIECNYNVLPAVPVSAPSRSSAPTPILGTERFPGQCNFQLGLHYYNCGKSQWLVR